MGRTRAMVPSTRTQPCPSKWDGQRRRTKHMSGMWWSSCWRTSLILAHQHCQWGWRSKKSCPPANHGDRRGFLGCSNLTVWVRAINCNTVYITSHCSSQIPVSIRTCYYEADHKRALVDSRATDNFIHPQLAARMQVAQQAFDKPKKIFNINNTENKLGSITHFMPSGKSIYLFDYIWFHVDFLIMFDSDRFRSEIRSDLIFRSW